LGVVAVRVFDGVAQRHVVKERGYIQACRRVNSLIYIFAEFASMNAPQYYDCGQAEREHKQQETVSLWGED